jgi:hypothetical protein
MTKHKLVWALAILSVFVCAPAWASHKAWVLYHTGGDCAFQSPQNHWFFGGDGGDMMLWNRHDYSRTAVCPIAAAGRWGSSSSDENFGVARWAEAKRAYVRVYNGHPTAALTCQAVARLRVSNAPGGSMYFGTARSVTGEGYHTIELVTTPPAGNPWTDWGGSLETNEGVRLRSLDFQCTLPATGSYYSHIRGYGVAICQHLAGCWEFNPTQLRSAAGEVSLQGNGASCTSSSGSVFRGADGLTPSLNQLTPVSCPIVPASQDSYEQGSGYFKRLRVYYSGTGSAGCESNGTCPSCSLILERASDASWQASSTFVWNAAGYLELLNSGVLPNWSSAAIQCFVPGGQRIRGYSAWGTQAEVSGGE